MKITERWTDEESRLLRELCAEKLSGAQIAVEMRRRTGSPRFTLGAIIGRMRRAGISLPPAVGSNGVTNRVRDFSKPERIAAPSAAPSAE